MAACFYPPHTPFPPFALQATSLKLGAEKEGLEVTVKEAQERLEQGLPPTEDAEREWIRYVCGGGVGGEGGTGHGVG